MSHMPAENPVGCWTWAESGIQGSHLDLVHGGDSACECWADAGLNLSFLSKDEPRMLEPAWSRLSPHLSHQVGDP